MARCKVGDVCIFTGKSSKNTGKICTILRAATSADLGPVRPRKDSEVWVTDTKFWWYRNGIPQCANNLVEDRNIRPLRNDPGPDETLAWKEVPKDDIVQPSPAPERAATD
jgi:hypothetical protein